MVSPVRIATVNQSNRISELRAQLLAAAVSYVRDGKDGSERQRLRTASSLSGMSENAIEAAIGKVNRITIPNDK